MITHIIYYTKHSLDKNKKLKKYFVSKIVLTTKDGLVIAKWPAGHGQELHPKPNFFVMAEAHLSATFGPKF